MENYLGEGITPPFHPNRLPKLATVFNIFFQRTPMSRNTRDGFASDGHGKIPRDAGWDMLRAGAWEPDPKYGLFLLAFAMGPILNAWQYGVMNTRTGIPLHVRWL